MAQKVYYTKIEDGCPRAAEEADVSGIGGWSILNEWTLEQRKVFLHKLKIYHVFNVRARATLCNAVSLTKHFVHSSNRKELIRAIKNLGIEPKKRAWERTSKTRKLREQLMLFVFFGENAKRL